LKKIIVQILIISSYLVAHDLVDALKGVKSRPEVKQELKQEVKKETKREVRAEIPKALDGTCDKRIIDAISDNNKSFFAGDAESLRRLNSCLIANDMSPMMMAAYVDRSAIVKMFLKAGVDANESNKGGYTALHFAAFYGNYEVVLALAEGGADVNAMNNIGQTPLMVAAHYGNTKTAGILSKKGANAQIRDRAGYTTGELIDSLNRVKPKPEIQAEVQKEVEPETQPTTPAEAQVGIQMEVRTEIPKSVDGVCDKRIIDAISDNNKSFFAGDAESLKQLNSCLIANDMSPMMMAAYIDRGQILKKFLKAGVKASEANEKGYTALHFAAFYGNYEIVVALLDSGADLNAMNNIGQTPLMVAAYYGNAKTVSILLKRGADTLIRDRAGYTAKELAEKKRRKEVLAIMK
jgi:uncharacterized protein